MLAVVQPDPQVGRVVLSRWDFYVWREGSWYGVDRFGLFDYLISPGWKRVLFGRTVSSEEFEEVHERAVRDPDFPRKSNFRPEERRP